MKKLLLLVMFILLVLPLSAHAQSGTLAYGETVTGEVTDAAFEIEFTFQGEANDIIVIDLLPTEAYEDPSLNEPALLLLDSSNAVLGALESQIVQEAQLVAQLPASGEYTIVATRNGGRVGTDTGTFNLTLNRATVLERGIATEGTMTNEQIVYYAVISETEFTLEFAKRGGEFFPQLTVNSIAEGKLTAAVTLYGKLLNSTVTVDASTLNSSLYIVILEEALFDFYFDPVSADYSIALGK